MVFPHFVSDLYPDRPWYIRTLDEYAYYSLNLDNLVPIPCYEDSAATNKTYGPRDYAKRQWASEKQPYVALFPSRPVFDGLLHVVRAPPELLPLQTVPINNNLTLHQFAAPIRDSIDLLEMQLKNAGRVLRTAVGARASIDQVFSPRLPTLYGVTSHFPSSAPLMTKYRSARMAFMCYVCYLAFLAQYLDNDEDVPRTSESAVKGKCKIWYRSLRDAGFHAAWIDELTCTDGFQKCRSPRVGCVVDPTTFYGRIDFVQQLVTLDVPVVLCRRILHGWRADDFPDLPPTLRTWLEGVIPRDDSISDAIAFARHVSSSEGNIETHVDDSHYFGDYDLSSMEDCNSAPFPFPDHELAPSSRQLSGETRETCLLRQVQARRDAMENSTDAELYMFRSREAAAKVARFPGKGSKVYFWEESSASPQWQIRKRATSSWLQANWPAYDGIQREYDCVSDEWDLWGTPSAEDWLLDMDDDVAPNVQPNSLQTADVSALMSAISFKDVEPLPVAPSPVSLIHALRHHVGFSWSQNEHTPYSPPALHPNVVAKSEKLIDYLVFVKDDPVNSIPPHFVTPLAHFLSFITGNEDNDKIPGTLWDLRFNSMDAIGYEGLHISKGKHVARDVEFRNSEFKAVYQIDLPVSNLTQDVRLFMKSATSVLHIKRASLVNSLTSVDAVALYCLERGMPFIMGIHRDLQPVGRGVPFPLPMPIREELYEVDSGDYKTYTAQLRRFFQHPRTWKALRMGGIVRRIALEHVPLQKGMLGPSEDAWKVNQAIQNIAQGTADFMDDGLTQLEIQFITGAYYGFNSELEVVRSWWPPHHTWEKGGLNLGIWTDRCESWYKKTKEMYVQPNLKIRLSNVREWERRLYYNKVTKSFREACEKRSATFITQGHM